MNSEPNEPGPDLPVFDGETDTTYTLDVVAKLAGVDRDTVLLYQRRGFIKTVVTPGVADAVFDIEALRQVRIIEHLRTTFEVNDASLTVILALLHEVEALRHERRQSLR